MTAEAAAADAPDDDVIASPVGREVGPDDDDAGGVEHAAPTVGRRPRTPLNRALFAKAAASVKAHLEGGDDDDETIAPTGSAAAAPPPAAAAAPADPPKQPERPAGPPPEAIAAWERVNLRAKDLDARETALKERESRTRDVAARFRDDPFTALKDTIRADLGDDASEDDVAEELAYQITVMSLGLSGATIDPSNTVHDLKKVKRELRQRKAMERKAAADAARASAESAKTERERAVVAQIGKEFEPLAQRFPWLATAEAPADLLFDVIKREHEKSGRLLELEEAAKLADDYLGQHDRSWFDKRKHLLAPTPPPTPTNATAPQGDPPTRRSRALTNADASEDAAPPPDAPGPRLSTEERRRRSFQRFREKYHTNSD